jgi:hypothetical protein
MGLSIGDAMVVAALAAAFVGYFYFKHRERQHRLDLVHEERLAAMEKGIPLPELPIDPPKIERPPNPRGFLVHGIVWTALGVGSMITVRLVEGPVVQNPVWPFPLPVALLGIGLMLYYFLVAERAR